MVRAPPAVQDRGETFRNVAGEEKERYKIPKANGHPCDTVAANTKGSISSHRKNHDPNPAQNRVDAKFSQPFPSQETKARVGLVDFYYLDDNEVEKMGMEEVEMLLKDHHSYLIVVPATELSLGISASSLRPAGRFFGRSPQYSQSQCPCGLPADSDVGRRRPEYSTTCRPAVSPILLSPKTPSDKPKKDGPEKGRKEYDAHYTNDGTRWFCEICKRTISAKGLSISAFPLDNKHDLNSACAKKAATGPLVQCGKPGSALDKEKEKEQAARDAKARPKKEKLEAVPPTPSPSPEAASPHATKRHSYKATGGGDIISSAPAPMPLQARASGGFHAGAGLISRPLLALWSLAHPPRHPLVLASRPEFLAPDDFRFCRGGTRRFCNICQRTISVRGSSVPTLPITQTLSYHAVVPIRQPIFNNFQHQERLPQRLHGEHENSDKEGSNEEEAGGHDQPPPITIPPPLNKGPSAPTHINKQHNPNSAFAKRRQMTDRYIAPQRVQVGHEDSDEGDSKEENGGKNDSSGHDHAPRQGYGTTTTKPPRLEEPPENLAKNFLSPNPGRELGRRGLQ
ncbi:hypothetical protein DL769_001230 [Monosporascus sp. CRB-8-3]|nr:hypothetical protein DL769_001230 [Monosporascus sp. CRB-8-3]